jgi:hypothetical protein
MKGVKRNYDFLDKDSVMVPVGENVKIFRFEPFNGEEVLQIYNDLKEHQIGHVCQCCDHCSVLCQQLSYGGDMHLDGGWCLHPLEIICDFHFILRMLATHYKLPKDVVTYIAKYVLISCKVMRWTTTGITTEGESYFE